MAMSTVCPLPRFSWRQAQAYSPVVRAHSLAERHSLGDQLAGAVRKVLP